MLVECVPHRTGSLQAIFLKVGRFYLFLHEVGWFSERTGGSQFLLADVRRLLFLAAKDIFKELHLFLFAFELFPILDDTIIDTLFSVLMRELSAAGPISFVYSILLNII